MLSPDLLARLRGHVFVLTGAGISVASGIRPFRGNEGLYRGFDPYTLASPQGFAADPATVWNWYLMRVRAACGAEPNAGHRALVDLEAKASELTLVTSNVDSLHERAGSQGVHHLHGDILQTLCIACGEVAPLDPSAWPEEVGADTLPTCPCGGTLRPNVVWFGESPWSAAVEAIRRRLPDAQVLLEVGTSGAVSYGLDDAAVGMGIPVIRVNPDRRPGRGVTELVGPAEEVLPRLVGLL